MRLAGKVDWDEVATVLTESYRLLAPKKLAAELGDVSPSKRAATRSRRSGSRRRGG